MIPASQYRPAPPIDPLTLSTGADGFFYNCQSLSNMRQDNLDTAAVVGQPVGMFFDNWVTNTLGSNIVTNGDFPTVTTGWTASGSTLSISSAHLRVTNSGAAVGRAYQSLTTVVGATYKCTIDLVTNADGATIAVGTANSTSNLFLLDIAAGVTGSYTFYFIASTTTSFIQMRTNVATAAKFTDWDNVVVKSIAGRHLIQQTSTARQILRQDANGHYYLEPDGVDDFLVGGLSYTVQLPNYLAVVARRKGAVLNETILGMYKNSTNYHRLFTATSRLDVNLREGTIGQAIASGTAAPFADPRLDIFDSLGVVGQIDICNARRVPQVAANSWLAGTQLTLCTPGIFANTQAAAFPQTNHFYAGLGMAQDPGASRAGIRAYLANLAGAD